MGFHLAVIPLISSSQVHKAKEAFACSIYTVVNLLINNWQLTKRIRPLIFVEIY